MIYEGRKFQKRKKSNLTISLLTYTNTRPSSLSEASGAPTSKSENLRERRGKQN